MFAFPYGWEDPKTSKPGNTIIEGFHGGDISPIDTATTHLGDGGTAI